jgi:hypothetical protein
MLLMGMGLVGGAAAALVPTSLMPLDQEVGTHTSAAGAVLGIGLMAAAVNPAGNIGWVRAGILYGFVVLGLEAGSYLLWRAPFHLGPVIFGLAFSLLLIATYPERKKLIPATSDFGGRPATITLPSSTSIKPRPVSTVAEPVDKGEETEPKD